MSDSAEDDLGLPPKLLAAVTEFTAWSQAQLLVEQSASTPTEPLYHYTREPSLRGILGGQKMWCFSHQHQSDPTEFEYALAVARQVIQEIGQSDDFFTKHFTACLQDLLDTNKLSGPFDFYLFSLSRHRDHGTQWDAFGDKGRGFAIGFAPSLFQPDRNELYEEANKNLHIGRVIYGDIETAARHRLATAKAAEITSRIGSANTELVRQVRPSHYLVTMARELLASQLIWNCLTAKDITYADEGEVRGIIMNVTNKFDPWRREFDGRPYVEHEMALKQPGAIAEILVGPNAPVESEQMIRDLLRAESYPEIPVLRSSAIC